MQEKRRNARWQINSQARINLFGDNPLLFDCVVNDITLRGARVSLPQKLPVEAALNMDIDFSAKLLLSNLEADIVWRDEADGKNSYGFCFKRIKDSDKEKIYDFVYKSCPQEITKCWWS